MMGISVYNALEASRSNEVDQIWEKCALDMREGNLGTYVALCAIGVLLGSQLAGSE